MKTKLFAHSAKGRLKAILALALLGLALIAQPAFAQTPQGQGDTPQPAVLNHAAELGTLSTALSPTSDVRVTALQQNLAAVGVSPGPIDGIYGPKTQQAVGTYQRQNGLAVDGVAGVETFTQLYYGGKQRVVRLQQDLRSQGMDPGPQDGLYGQKTEQAVAGFQTKAGLATDGIAGPKTFSQLEPVSAQGPPQVQAPAPAQAKPVPQGTATTGAKPAAKSADHTLAVVLANAVFALAVFAIARTLFRRREQQREEVESHLIALAEEEEEERYRTQTTPRSRRRSPPRTNRMTSTPWTDPTSELDSSSTSSYSWQKGGEDQ